MAMEDYLTGSQFGKVAGSLLSSRDSDWKKALAVSAIGSVLQNLNVQKQTDNQQAMQRTTEEYNRIFENNEEKLNF